MSPSCLLIFILFYFYLSIIQAQLAVQLVAGIVGNGYSGDGGSALSAIFNVPIGLWLDSIGNLYICDQFNYRIRRITPTGIISTFGGTGISSTTDLSGTITAVSFKNPFGIIGDTQGTGFYFADRSKVWYYSFTTGIITVLAGSPIAVGSSGDDGPATSALLNNPINLMITTSISSSSNSLFIVDSGNCNIRVINLSTPGNIINRYAGGLDSSSCGYNGDDKAATLTQLQNPRAIWINTLGISFIADGDNNRIRKIDTNGIMTTIVGDGSSGYYGDGGPAISAILDFPSDIKGDSIGRLFIADFNNCRIRFINPSLIIYTLVGSGTCGFALDLTIATNANINSPNFIFIDTNTNNLYFSDGIIHKTISISPTISPTFKPTSPTFQPTQIPSQSPSIIPSVFPSINPTVSPTIIPTIIPSRIPTLIPTNAPTLYPSQSPSVMPTVPPSQSPTATPSNSPSRIPTTTPSIAPTIVPSINPSQSPSLIPSINPSQSPSLIPTASPSRSPTMIPSIAPTIMPSISPSQSPSLIPTISPSQIPTIPPSISPTIVPSINLQLVLQRLAGNGTNSFAGDGGTATSASLNQPIGLWFDSIGSLYICDWDNYRIRRVDSAGIISTFGGTGIPSASGTNGAIGSVSFFHSYAIVGDIAGSGFYFSDYLKVWYYSFSSGIISVIAGSTQGSSGDGGPSISALLYNPRGLMVTSTSLFIADSFNCNIRVITLSSNTINRYAGGLDSSSCGYGGDGGQATSAKLMNPFAIWINTLGVSFIADYNNNRIRKMATDGIISTFAGTGTVGSSGDNGPATAALLSGPYDVKGDTLGNLFLSDRFNCKIRYVNPVLIINTLVGTGICGSSPDYTSVSTINDLYIWIQTAYYISVMEMELSIE